MVEAIQVWSIGSRSDGMKNDADFFGRERKCGAHEKHVLKWGMER